MTGKPFVPLHCRRVPLMVKVPGAIALASLAALPACKPQSARTSASDLMSLNQASRTTTDEAAARDAAAYGTPDAICGLSLRDPLQAPPRVAPYAAQLLVTSSAATATNLRATALGALAAAPEPLLQLFFVAGRGRIEIVDATSDCAGVGVSKEQRQLLGGKTSAPPTCWLAPTATTPLRLVVQADPATIRTSLLPLLTAVETEFFLTTAEQPNAPATFGGSAWPAYAAGFASHRNRLATAFLADATAAKVAGLAAYQQLHAADLVAFGNLAYSQLTAAYYCSTASRQRLETGFRQSWAVFTDTTDAYAPLRELGRSPLFP